MEKKPPRAPRKQVKATRPRRAVAERPAAAAKPAPARNFPRAAAAPAGKGAAAAPAAKGAAAAPAAKGAAAVAGSVAGGAAAPVPGWVDKVLSAARERGARTAAKLRVDHPGQNPRQLGERLVKSSAFKAGLLGAATGTLSLVALPVGLPAGIATTLFLEAELLFALLALYGLEGSGAQGRARLAALWLGAGFADAAKSAGLKLGANAAGRALAGSLPARIIARLNPALVQAILKRLGLGWLPRAAKLWPILGAPFAFAIDRAALRTLGSAALRTLDDARRDSVKVV
jgi:hypothetical protein